MHSADCLQKEGRKTTSGRFGSVTYGRGVTELSTLFKRKTLFIRIGYDHECPRAQGERSVGLGHIFQWTPRPGSRSSRCSRRGSNSGRVVVYE